MSLGDHAHERHFPDSCLTSVRLRFLAIQKCWSWDPQQGSLPETQGGVRCYSRLHSHFSQRFCLYGGAVHTKQVTRGQRFPSNFVTKPSHAHPGSSSRNPRHRASYRPHSRCKKTFWESWYECMKTRSILSSGDGRQRLLPRLWPENGDHIWVITSYFDYFHLYSPTEPRALLVSDLKGPKRPRTVSMAFRERLANHGFVLGKIWVWLAVLSRYAPSGTQVMHTYIQI